MNCAKSSNGVVAGLSPAFNPLENKRGLKPDDYSRIFESMHVLDGLPGHSVRETDHPQIVVVKTS